MKRSLLPQAVRALPRQRCPFMSKLEGREILIVEDEPLIALEIASAFREVGANTTTTTTLKQALTLVDHDGLAVAILDHSLRDGDSTVLCDRLRARNVPFVLYSGLTELKGAAAGGLLVEKPASAAVLIAAVEGLLSSEPPSLLERKKS
jgi:DNA-binding response OmpR family regulator